MLSVVLADLITGRRIIHLPYSSAQVEKRYLSPETMRATLNLKDPAVRRLGIRNVAAVGKTLMAIFDGEVCLGAGPIWDHDWSHDDGTVSLEAAGIWTLVDTRNVLPASASTVPLLVPSGETAGEPNPATRTSFVGKTWPQIVYGLLTQMMTRPGASLPLVFGPDGVGAHDKTYEGSAFKSVGDALRDLTRLVDGPELEFTPRLTQDGLGFEWVVRVGDDSKLELSSATVHRFDFTPAKKSVRGLTVKSSATAMAAEAWATGGRQSAEALISRAETDRLLKAGYPRMEIVSSANSTVVEKATLDSYAAQYLRNAGSPLDWWEFETHIDQTPRLTDLNIGDYCDVVLPDTGYLPAGTTRRRIVGISMSHDSRWAKITTDEEMTNV